MFNLDCFLIWSKQSFETLSARWQLRKSFLCFISGITGANERVFEENKMFGGLSSISCRTVHIRKREGNNLICTLIKAGFELIFINLNVRLYAINNS